MGGAGCGAATAVIFYIEFLLMFLLVYFNPKHRPYRRHIIPGGGLRLPSSRTWCGWACL